MKGLIDGGRDEEDWILNMDETSIPTEINKAKTIEVKGASNVKIKTTGKEKDCTTVVLSGTMSGKKLKAMIIIKSKGKKKIQTSHDNIKIYFREKGSWMDFDGMTYFINNILSPWSRTIPEGKRALLLLDNCKSHINYDIEDKLRKLKIDTKKFPSNTTSYLQPLDLTVNGPLKRHYETLWDDYQFNNQELTKKAKNFKNPSKETKVDWIGKSWASITEETMQKGFKLYKKTNEVSIEQVSLEDDIPNDEIALAMLEKEEENLSDEKFDNQDELNEEENEDFNFSAEPEDELLKYEIIFNETKVTLS